MISIPAIWKKPSSLGVDWQNKKAIETFKFATDGYFIIGGTDYPANRLNDFIKKLNS